MSSPVTTTPGPPLSVIRLPAIADVPPIVLSMEGLSILDVHTVPGLPRAHGTGRVGADEIPLDASISA